MIRGIPWLVQVSTVQYMAEHKLYIFIVPSYSSIRQSIQALGSDRYSFIQVFFVNILPFNLGLFHNEWGPYTISPLSGYDCICIILYLYRYIYRLNRRWNAINISNIDTYIIVIMHTRAYYSIDLGLAHSTLDLAKTP